VSRAVYVAPLQALATERLADWATRFGEGLGARVLELTGDPATDTRLLGEVCALHAATKARSRSSDVGTLVPEQYVRVQVFVRHKMRGNLSHSAWLSSGSRQAGASTQHEHVQCLFFARVAEHERHQPMTALPAPTIALV